jgi:hypothetical protein
MVCTWESHVKSGAGWLAGWLADDADIAACVVFVPLRSPMHELDSPCAGTTSSFRTRSRSQRDCTALAQITVAFVAERAHVPM